MPNTSKKLPLSEATVSEPKAALRAPDKQAPSTLALPRFAAWWIGPGLPQDLAAMSGLPSACLDALAQQGLPVPVLRGAEAKALGAVDPRLKVREQGGSVAGDMIPKFGLGMLGACVFSLLGTLLLPMAPPIGLLVIGLGSLGSMAAAGWSLYRALANRGAFTRALSLATSQDSAADPSLARLAKLCAALATSQLPDIAKLDLKQALSELRADLESDPSPQRREELERALHAIAELLRAPQSEQHADVQQVLAMTRAAHAARNQR